jgi:flagellar FliJ protein
VTPSQWANFRDFLQKLDDAITQQTALVSESATRTVEGQKRWLGERNRVKAFDSLATKHAASERYLEGRQEQKAVDELSARRHRSNREDQ